MSTTETGDDDAIDRQRRHRGPVMTTPQTGHDDAVDRGDPSAGVDDALDGEFDAVLQDFRARYVEKYTYGTSTSYDGH